VRHRRRQSRSAPRPNTPLGEDRAETAISNEAKQREPVDIRRRSGRLTISDGIGTGSSTDRCWFSSRRHGRGEPERRSRRSPWCASSSPPGTAVLTRHGNGIMGPRRVRSAAISHSPSTPRSGCNTLRELGAVAHCLGCGTNHCRDFR